MPQGAQDCDVRVGTVGGLFPNLTIVRLALTLEVASATRLESPASAFFRGQWLRHFRDAECLTGAAACFAGVERTRCPEMAACGYGLLVESSGPVWTRRFAQPPRPYVVEPPEVPGRVLDAGERLEVGLVLIGWARLLIPRLVTALEEACARSFGWAARGRPGSARLVQVAARRTGSRDETASLSDGAVSRAFVLRERDLLSEVTEPAERRVVLRLATPLRLKNNTHLRPPTAKQFFSAAFRRVAELDGLYGSGRELDPFRLPAHLEEAFAGPGLGWEERALRWIGLRQSKKRGTGAVDLSGWVGEVRVDGDLAPWRPLLAWSEHVHVGSGAAFGNGRLIVERG